MIGTGQGLFRYIAFLIHRISVGNEGAQVACRQSKSVLPAPVAGAEPFQLGCCQQSGMEVAMVKGAQVDSIAPLPADLVAVAACFGAGVKSFADSHRYSGVGNLPAEVSDFQTGALILTPPAQGEQDQ